MDFGFVATRKRTGFAEFRVRKKQFMKTLRMQVKEKLQKINEDNHDNYEEDMCDDYDDAGDSGFDDHRYPSRLESDFILVTFAPLHWGPTLPGG